MKKIVVSAPGKLHLSGEHAVVYGKPAVLVSTSKRIRVSIEERITAPTRYTIDSPHKEFTEAIVLELIHDIEHDFDQEIKNAHVSITSEIPIGVGMGSSAALAVALTGALQQYFGKQWNVSEINETAFRLEKLTHKNPSGGDNTIASFGGMLWYRKEFDFLKTFWLLPLKFPQKFAPFVIINTGRVEKTADLINIVAQIPQTKRDDIMSEIEKVTKKLVNALYAEDEVVFKQAITQNQILLNQLGVVSTATQKLIAEIEKSGGVAKISGAGGIIQGSGIVLAMHKDPTVVENLAKKYNYPIFANHLGGEGVKIERIIV